MSNVGLAAQNGQANATNYVAQITENFLKEATSIAERYRLALPVGEELSNYVPVLTAMSERASADELEKVRIAALMTARDGLDYLKADYIATSMKMFRDRALRPQGRSQRQRRSARLNDLKEKSAA